MTRQVQSQTLIKIKNSKTSNSRRTFDKRRETRMETQMAAITLRKAATLPSIQASEAQETDPRVHLTDLQVLLTDQERAS